MAEMKSQPVLAAISRSKLQAGDLGDRIRFVRRLKRAGQERVLADRLRRKPWVDAA